MPDVHFEIIRLEDIGRGIVKPNKHSHQHHRSAPKLSDIDVENLKHYLHRYNQGSHKNEIDSKPAHEILSVDLNKSIVHGRPSTTGYVDITEDFYSNKSYADIDKQSSEHSQPLIDIYRYHHHYRRQHSHTKHGHDNSLAATGFSHDLTFLLELATCGMKKNTRLPVPHQNFSLANGCFGDDAGFTMKIKRKHFLGISDGAGGNLMYGFNPRLFSESLMRNCSDLAHTGDYSTAEPKRLLCHAFDRVQNENCFGSATACVVGIDSHTGQLHSVNIGDSGYVILRQGHVIYRSRSQKMNGDCPRQLDVYPWTASLKNKGLNYTQISSLDAICQNFQLELDDVIILSTDGLFDNVPDRLIERILTSSGSLKHAANELVNHAVRFYTKPDDILVIMAKLVNNKNNNYVEQ